MSSTWMVCHQMTGLVKGLVGRLISASPQTQSFSTLSIKSYCMPKYHGYNHENKIFSDQCQVFSIGFSKTSSPKHHLSIKIYWDTEMCVTGSVRERFIDLKDAITEFLDGCHHENALIFKTSLQDEDFVENVCFVHSVKSQ
jgi:hypothetical protein